MSQTCAGPGCWQALYQGSTWLVGCHDTGREAQCCSHACCQVWADEHSKQHGAPPSRVPGADRARERATAGAPDDGAPLREPDRIFTPAEWASMEAS